MGKTVLLTQNLVFFPLNFTDSENICKVKCMVSTSKEENGHIEENKDNFLVRCGGSIL
jgi:hypothetical protein